jgi:hypothetical protein
MEDNISAAEVRREAMLKKIIAREFQHIPNNVHIPMPGQIFGGGEFLSVEITVPSGEDNQQQMHVVVQPRYRKQLLAPKLSNHSTQMRIWKDTVSAEFKP